MYREPLHIYHIGVIFARFIRRIGTANYLIIIHVFTSKFKLKRYLDQVSRDRSVTVLKAHPKALLFDPVCREPEERDLCKPHDIRSAGSHPARSKVCTPAIKESPGCISEIIWFSRHLLKN